MTTKKAGASESRAKVKPASGSAPGGENAPGKIVEQTAPNTGGSPTNPPIKPETAPEGSLLQKAGDLLEMGEIGILNDAKDAVQGGIDGAVEAAGGGMVASAVGAVGLAVVEVFFPTNVIDLVPGGKVLSGGKKAGKVAEKAAKEAAEKAAKEAAEKEAKEAAEKAAKEAKKADGGGGGYSTSSKRKPKNRCELMKYKDMICDGEKHHVLPDWTLRTGNSKTKSNPATRIPGTPAYEDGLAICLSQKEHQGIHKTVDEKIGRASSGGTVPMGKAKEISTKEASKRSGCSAKELRKQLDEGVAAADDTLIRGEKDARKVTPKMKGKYGKQGD